MRDMYQMPKICVAPYWDARAGLAVYKVLFFSASVPNVGPMRDALGAGQGLTKFVHPRLDESIMLL